MSQVPSTVEAEILEKGLAALARWGAANQQLLDLQAQIELINAEKAAANTEYDEVAIAAKVFSLNLDELLDRYFADKKSPTPDTPEPAALAIPAKAIREVVLEMAEAAFPGPVRAAAVQQEVQKWRGPLHYKTIGMTMYRLSKEGLMRREGQKDWFFVPPEQRTKNPAVDAAGQEDFGL